MTDSTDKPLQAFPDVVDFGREICCDLSSAESREWLVTNGIGGYASGTLAGHMTRSYHGLLVAALQPPLGRTLLLAKLDETVHYGGAQLDLATNRWVGGVVSPQGYLHVERFHLEGTTPVWTFALEDALLEKRIFMAASSNTTYVLYRLARGSGPVELSMKALVGYSAQPCTATAGQFPIDVVAVEHGVRATAFDGAVPFFLLSDAGNFQSAKEWYRGVDLAAERARGLCDHTDLFYAGSFHVTLTPGQSFTIVASTEDLQITGGLDGGAAFKTRLEGERNLLDKFDATNVQSQHAPLGAIKQLALAADQFIVARPLNNSGKTQTETQTILAGYPWFSDWGRDAMVALPGLCLVTGRPAIARSILTTFSHFVSEGMLPNRFPDVGSAPEYNTADATLWYFQAIREYFEATKDMALLRELYPMLEGIVDAHVRGTRYNIHVDPEDGLLYAGQEGTQLTWMDAKVGNRAVTPRIGKPVEINALWLNAVSTMAQFAHAMDTNPDRYSQLAQRTRTGFDRFWNASKQFCFDVIDGPNGKGDNDATLRPNQIFAVSLPESPLTPERQRAVVNICASELLTSFGLRSLGRVEPGYQGRYGGSVEERDAAYHQGTAWGWLLGPFAIAHLRIFKNVAKAKSFLMPTLQHIQAAGLGTASEIFDGDEPFAPNGCIAQAWTVSETLRAWHHITKAENNEVNSDEA